MRNVPKVTIAIPTLNRCQFLKQAVKSALRQTHENLEVIVADNCSEDSTAEFLHSVSDERVVKIRHCCRIPMLENWDSCLTRATGEYFMLLSDDDYLEDTAVESLLSGFTSVIPNGQEGKAVGMAYGITRIIDQENGVERMTRLAPLFESAEEVGRNYFRRLRDIYACSCMLPTDDLREIGGYSSLGTKLAADASAWSCAVLKRGYVSFIPVPVAAYRIHLNNETALNSIETWVQDLEHLVHLWTNEASARGSQVLANSIAEAGQQYIAWTVSMLINKSASVKGARVQAVRAYYKWRSRFTGIREHSILVQGILRLALAPCLAIIGRVWKDILRTRKIISVN